MVFKKDEWHKTLAHVKQHELRQIKEPGRGSQRRPLEYEDHILAELAGLRRQITEITSERDTARRQVQLLVASLANVMPAKNTRNTAFPVARVARPSVRTIMFAVTFLLLCVLVSVTTFRDAQSMVSASVQSDTSGGAGPVQLSEAGPAAETGGKKDKKKNRKKVTPPPKTGKAKTRFAFAGDSGFRQWGPPLLLPRTPGKKSHHAFDPVVQDMQRNLLVLGFDLGEADGFKGERTRQALHEFASLYLAGSGLKQTPGTEELAVILRNYAALARADSGSFKIDSGVVAAIRLTSVRTGVDFSYLMELAAAESNFDPHSEATTSSATGLYQFTHDTWLNTLKSHGGKYGLQEYVSKIEFYVDRRGYQRPMVGDKTVYQHLMDLRKNPRVSAMMVAETIKDNLQTLTFSFDRNPVKTDLYLTHFLGTQGAISFLKALDNNPDAFAVDMFPMAAQSNKDIFHPRTCEPRTVNEVYELFGSKFNTSRFDEWSTN